MEIKAMVRIFAVLTLRVMRSTTLKQRRDMAIVRKFHKLYDVERKRMDDVLKEMSEEHFFLDPKYLYTIIFYNKKNNDYYSELLNGATATRKEARVRSSACRDAYPELQLSLEL